MTRLRTGAGVSLQAGNAARAAATASRVSSRVESGAKPIISSRLAGLRRSEERVAEDSAQRPLIKLRQVWDVETAVAMPCSLSLRGQSAAAAFSAARVRVISPYDSGR